jgi:glutathione S-transferase
MLAYAEAAQKRGTGFAIQAFATFALLIGAVIAILWRIVHG